MEALQRASVAFVLRRLYTEMFQWGEASSLRLGVILDEAHRVAQDRSLGKLAKESRKYGISLVVASQSVADFNPATVENLGSRVAFRSNHPESRRVAEYLHFRGRAAEGARLLEELGVGQAYVQTTAMPYADLVRISSGPGFTARPPVP